MSDSFILFGNKFYIIFKNSDKNSNLYYVEDLEQFFPKYKTFHLTEGKYCFINDKDEISYKAEKRLIILIGEVENNFLVLDKEVFDIEHEFRFEKHLIKLFEVKHFLASRKISIIGKIDKLICSEFVVTYEDSSCDNWISWATYQKMVSEFPSVGQLNKYSHMKIDESIGDFIEMKLDYSEIYENYMRKKNKKRQVKHSFINRSIDTSIAENEIVKYQIVLDKLRKLIEVDCIETVWQKSILDIITLIYPHYKYAIDEVKLSNCKRVDFILIDLFDNVDIIEIKSPKKELLRKTKYRGNYTVNTELSGAVIQVENYIFELMQNSSSNSKKIQVKFKKANIDLDVKINNPKGIIIMGRTKDFDEEQLAAYRIIKNHYSNIANIISYDELIDILSNLVNRFEKQGLSNHISVDGDK